MSDKDMDGPESGQNQQDGAGQSQKVLQNTTPAFVQQGFYLVVGALEKYGWFILIGAILLIYIWHKFKPQLTRIFQKWEDQEYMKKYDPIQAAEQQTKMDEARRRWQEVNDAKAAKYEEEKKKCEEERRKEMIEDWERHKEGKGYRSKKYKKADDTSLAENVLKPTKKKPLRESDYSPLSGGGGGGSCYRPNRRGGGGGGG